MPTRGGGGDQTRWRSGTTVDPETFGRLRIALSALTGIESLVVVRDVCHYPVDEGQEALAWAARTLVRAVIDRSG